MSQNHLPVGTTDSEHAFCWILDGLLAKFGADEPDDKSLYHYIASLSEQINHLGVTNLIISNGDCLFAFCSNNLHWVTRRAPFGEASLIDAEMVVDFQQETSNKDVVSVIATRPLTDDETWHKMQPGQWQVFRLGEVLLGGQTKEIIWPSQAKAS